MSNRVVHLAAVSMCVLGAGAIISLAGPLNPPAGPVATTYKTLTEVEPRIAVNATNTPGDADSLFKITLPGSYYLTGNITGVVGKHGIEIGASGVTLDLNGFDLAGVAAMGAFNGVTVTGSGQTNIAVVNGSIRKWGGHGIELSASFSPHCRVDRVCASDNNGAGILLDSDTTVTNCLASNNGNIGVFVGFGATVSDCIAFDNAGGGIGTSNGATVTNCAADRNGGNGITTGFGCTVTGCTAWDNIGDGFDTGNGSTVTNCTAVDNAANGIDAHIGSTVEGCTARNNTENGIECASSCVIRGNSSSSSGWSTGLGAGISATGGRNRIEGNNCTNNDFGITVDVAGNVIIRNTCAGNTINWVIAANNVCGPILDRTAPVSAAINGNSAPDSTGSTHPNANFTY